MHQTRARQRLRGWLSAFRQRVSAQRLSGYTRSHRTSAHCENVSGGMHDSLTCSKLAVDEARRRSLFSFVARCGVPVRSVCNGRYHTALHARREPTHSSGQAHRRRVWVSDCATAILQERSTVACATVAAQFGECGAMPTTGVCTRMRCFLYARVRLYVQRTLQLCACNPVYTGDGVRCQHKLRALT